MSEHDERLICGTYDRVSSKTQGQQGFGMQSRRGTTEEWFARHPWLRRSEDPSHRYQDGLTANAPGDRWDLPELTRMLDAAKRGEFQVLVVPDHDRFSREVGRAEVLKKRLAEYGVMLVFESVDLADSDEADMIHTQFFANAQYARKKLRQRSMDGRREKAEQQKVVGGCRAPYGYRYVVERRKGGDRPCGLEPDVESGRADIWRLAMLDLLTISTRELARRLTARGVPPPTRRATRWTDGTVYKMAVNPVYKGEWWFHPGVVRRGEPQHPPVLVRVEKPLLSEAEWDAVQAALAARRNRRPAKNASGDDDPYTLRGVLVCGGCGQRLHTTWRGPKLSRVRYYVCPCEKRRAASLRGKPHCATPAYHAADLEREASERLIEAFDEATFEAALRAAQVRHAAGAATWADDLRAIDALVAERTAELERWVTVLMEPTTGAATRKLVAGKQAELETVLGELTARRAAIEAMPKAGTSAADAAALRRYRAEALIGLETTRPSVWRDLCRVLKLEGRVTPDPAGIKLGYKHRVRVEWTAEIAIRPSGANLWGDAPDLLAFGATPPKTYRLRFASALATEAASLLPAA